MKKVWRDINKFLAKYMTPGVRLLFLANVIVFLLVTFLAPLFQTIDFFAFMMMQTPYLVLFKGCVWQLVTYMFMHGSLGHLFCNMLGLWFFAPRLEYRWGTAGFLKFYFVVGIAAGLFHPVLALFANSTQPIFAWLIDSKFSIVEIYQIAAKQNVLTMLGASGAIYGVLLAYALYWPNDTVLLYFVIPVKIKYLMIGLAIFTFYYSLPTRGGEGVSHITHLGGLLVAALYLKGPEWFNRWKYKRRRARVVQVDPNNHPDFH